MWSFRNTLQNSTHTGLKASFEVEVYGLHRRDSDVSIVCCHSPLEKPLQELSAMSKFVIVAYQMRMR